MRLSGADIIVKTLIEQGCDTVFGYPGGQILNVYDSLYTHQNEIITYSRRMSRGRHMPQTVMQEPQERSG